MDKMVLLADIFDVSVDYLLGREEEAKKVITIEVPSNQEFEYQSKWKLFGLPLVHIHLRYTLGWRFGIRTDWKRCDARGVIAIGNHAMGLVAIGLRSIGVFSIGLLSFGLCTLGMISIGAISLGIVSLGYCSFGIVAIGIYALGVLAVGGQMA